MSTVTGDYKQSFKFAQKPGSDYQGQAYAEIDTSVRVSTGTGKNQANLMHHDADNALAGTTAEDIDFLALLDPFETAIAALVEICFLRIEWDSTNAGNAEIKQSAANGWTSFFKDVSDIVILEPGTALTLECWEAAAYLVGAANKSINVNNLGTAATYKITLIGRNA